MKTGEIAKRVAGRGTGLWATATAGLHTDVLAIRDCKPTKSGSCLSLGNIT